MVREISRGRALANLFLVGAVVALAGWGLSHVARRHWQWQPTFRARAEFTRIGGLEVGAKVRVLGMDAGVVDEVVPPAKPGGPVTVAMRLDRSLRNLVRIDATATITTQGVLGAKVVEITPGQPDASPLADGGAIRSETPTELADLLRDASNSLKRVDAVAASAESGLRDLTAIAALIRAGKGTLGHLVKDDEAYRRLISMAERGERALGDLDENLLALKRVWPLSRYFNQRGFDDRDRVLYQPGSERESRTLAGDDLFEPGRAVLTANGRKQLDDVGAWFNRLRRPKSTEIVIAAFTDRPADDEEMAQLLSQEQAEAVRRYLSSHYGVDSVGWFGSRKVAAVGFGTQVPRPYAERARELIPRRVEVILFTPQT